MSPIRRRVTFFRAAVVASAFAVVAFATFPARAALADAGYSYTAESVHTYGCPPDYDDPSCGSDAWGPPTIAQNGPSSVSETWTETFTLTGGSGSAHVLVNGGVLGVLGADSGGAEPAPFPVATISDEASGSDAALRFNGHDLASVSQFYDPAHPAPVGSEFLPLDASLSVVYDVPFTLSVTMDSFARLGDVVVDCGPATRGASCTYFRHAFAELNLAQFSFAVPTGATLSAASGAFYPVTSVPEPPAWAMFELGCVGLLAVRRRRRA